MFHSAKPASAFGLEPLFWGILGSPQKTFDFNKWRCLLPAAHRPSICGQISQSQRPNSQQKEPEFDDYLKLKLREMAASAFGKTHPNRKIPTATRRSLKHCAPARGHLRLTLMTAEETAAETRRGAQSQGFGAREVSTWVKSSLFFQEKLGKSLKKLGTVQEK